ncbi:hypothetical protein B0H14DRAFT_2622293 [Mycena olivaceomarginata]|nr:hypothetical protein B0H14DRAFT_2622293 [Mycena olivaceomarginata]
MSTLSPSPKTPRSKMRTGLEVELFLPTGRLAAGMNQIEDLGGSDVLDFENILPGSAESPADLRKLKLRGGDRTDLKAEWLAFSNYKISMVGRTISTQGQRSTLSAEKKGGGSLSHLDEKSDIEHHLSSELIGDMTSSDRDFEFQCSFCHYKGHAYQRSRTRSITVEKRRRRSIEVSKRPVVTAGASGGQDGTADQQKSFETRSRLGQELEFARKDDEPRGVRRKSYGAFPRAFDPVLTLAALRQQNRRDQVEMEERKRQEARGLRVD